MLKVMTDHSPQDREQASRAAREDLKKLGDSESVFTGSISTTVKRATTHFAGHDDASDDAVEIWGKRIGRSLSLIGVFALGIYLYLTYAK